MLPRQANRLVQVPAGWPCSQRAPQPCRYSDSSRRPVPRPTVQIRCRTQPACALKVALSGFSRAANPPRVCPAAGGRANTQPEPRLTKFIARMEPIRLRLLAATTVHDPGTFAIEPSYTVTGIAPTPFTNSCTEFHLPGLRFHWPPAVMARCLQRSDRLPAPFRIPDYGL